MTNRTTSHILEQPTLIVKSKPNTQFPLLPGSMIHHKVHASPDKILIRLKKGCMDKAYGVSSSRRVLTPGLFLKKYDYIKQGLRVVLGLSPCQREVVLRLLRLWAYYGQVYPKAKTVVGEYELTERQSAWRASEGLGAPPRRGEIGRATFWRTIALLKEMELIQVVNRFIFRPHAQISNLYRLDKLAILLAKYLAEHIGHIWDEWLMPYLRLPWQALWELLTAIPGDRAGPSESVA